MLQYLRQRILRSKETVCNIRTSLVSSEMNGFMLTLTSLLVNLRTDSFFFFFTPFHPGGLLKREKNLTQSLIITANTQMRRNHTNTLFVLSFPRNIWPFLFFWISTRQQREENWLELTDPVIFKFLIPYLSLSSAAKALFSSNCHFPGVYLQVWHKIIL